MPPNPSSETEVPQSGSSCSLSEMDLCCPVKVNHFLEPDSTVKQNKTCSLLSRSEERRLNLGQRRGVRTQDV